MKKLLFLLLPLGFLSCASEPEKDEKSPTAPQLIGRVAAVHEREGFVLIEGYGDLVPAAGLLVTTRGNGRTATLEVTGERSGRYSAADLKGGTAAVGDAAYGRPTREETVEPETAPSAPPVTGTP